MMTVRNRLAITKKTIEALKRHTETPWQLYVYDNLTNYKIQEHVDFLGKAFINGDIAQLTFNSATSTFDAFSKAVASNQFGYSHLNDPNRKNYDFLMLLDNDMIVMPGWDKVFLEAWRIVRKKGWDHIKYITQFTGGLSPKNSIPLKIQNYDCYTGKHGGSGFWTVRTNFFEDVGFLNIKETIGLNKQHDQKYWGKLETASKGKNYGLGIRCEKVYHTGGLAGSICNILTREKESNDKLNKIKFEEKEDTINRMSFDTFIKHVESTKKWTRW